MLLQHHAFSDVCRCHALVRLYRSAPRHAVLIGSRVAPLLGVRPDIWRRQSIQPSQNIPEACTRAVRAGGWWLTARRPSHRQHISCKRNRAWVKTKECQACSPSLEEGNPTRFQNRSYCSADSPPFTPAQKPQRSRPRRYRWD